MLYEWINFSWKIKTTARCRGPLGFCDWIGAHKLDGKHAQNKWNKTVIFSRGINSKYKIFTLYLKSLICSNIHFLSKMCQTSTYKTCKKLFPIIIIQIYPQHLWAVYIHQLCIQIPFGSCSFKSKQYKIWDHCKNGLIS
jgi:hypothetical protein